MTKPNRPSLQSVVDATSKDFDAQLEEGRARRVHAIVDRATAPRARRHRVLLAVALAPVVVAVGVFFSTRPEEPALLMFVAGAPSTPGASVAADTGPLVVSFSDGTTLQVSPHGRARVAGVSGRGARVELEAGALDATVTHRERSAWTVLAGPYQVHVTGTAFSVTWDPSLRVFELRLREGRVEVDGPVVGHRVVSAGQGLRLTQERTLEVLDHDASGEAPQAAEASPDAFSPDASSDLAAPDASTGGSPTEPLPTTKSRWVGLAERGRYFEAAAAIDERARPKLLRELPPARLLLLADVARFVGKPSQAVEALEALRRRFPGSTSAVEAAWALGRVHADQRDDVSAAVSAFEAAYREDPTGELAEPSLGRLMELFVSSHDEPRALDTARRYRAQFPTGPHAAEALKVIKGSQ